jgi:hypothetical protein
MRLFLVYTLSVLLLVRDEFRIASAERHLQTIQFTAQLKALLNAQGVTEDQLRQVQKDIYHTTFYNDGVAEENVQRSMSLVWGKKVDSNAVASSFGVKL